MVLLHGGWGYGLNPFDRQIDELRYDFRLIGPDRSGYGQSTPHISELPEDFHYHAAVENLSLLDRLDIESAYLWGHSDGAVSPPSSDSPRLRGSWPDTRSVSFFV